MSEFNPLAQLRADFLDLRRSGIRKVRRIVRDARLDDDARFLKSWFDKPLVTGAVSPSGKALARMMAGYVDASMPGPVIEIGPGTGPVTEALIARGIPQERLVLVEFNPAFCSLLRRRFPRATIIEGDAYGLDITLGELGLSAAAATVSSLPLFTKPEAQRLGLLNAAFAMMHPGAPFIQFTYAAVSPMPLGKIGDGFKRCGFDAKVSPRVWLNLPPACVWVYRKLQA